MHIALYIRDRRSLCKFGYEGALNTHHAYAKSRHKIVDGDLMFVYFRTYIISHNSYTAIGMLRG